MKNLLKKKTPAAPATVSEAVAPFATVRDNLKVVVEKNAARAAEANRRVSDARAYLEQVEADEQAAEAAAAAEIAKATKIADALTSILGDA